MFNSLLDRAEKFFTQEAGEQIAYHEPKFGKTLRLEMNSIFLFAGFPPAIVHGDLWSPNILFTKDENENASNELAAIIDWQSAHPGKKAWRKVSLCWIHLSWSKSRKFFSFKISRTPFY